MLRLWACVILTGLHSSREHPQGLVQSLYQMSYTPPLILFKCFFLLCCSECSNFWATDLTTASRAAGGCEPAALHSTQSQSLAAFYGTTGCSLHKPWAISRKRQTRTQACSLGQKVIAGPICEAPARVSSVAVGASAGAFNLGEGLPSCPCAKLRLQD